MADVIVELKVMPASVETDLNALKNDAEKMIKEFGADLGKVEETPIAFGLKALMLTIVFDEAKGSTDDLEEKIASLDSVESCNVTRVSRALG
ncbi:elongation factor 1-beta [Candidatus Woesearchaeota archaeon CG10_big_fil_rev_8_21_14_0_10_34_8]|nr:MAG: elongation factor 1-beta [Candidatus Woesearchaeota archaeon CG10_big_fil_rev_8_21_14_0_10_34_8]